MVRDREAFRERFRQYKEGKSVNEIYNLPGYAKGHVPLDDTIEFLKLYEGFKDTTYLDGKGIPTIGYGFTDSALVKKGKITRAEADARLNKELLDRESFLLKLKNWDKLSEESKTALRSYYYNYPAGFKDSTRFMRYWNSGQYRKAIREVDAGWNDEANPGLKKRRLAEQALLLSDPFLTQSAIPEPQIGYVAQPDAIKQAVATSIPVIPQEQTISTVDPSLSPYLTNSSFYDSFLKQAEASRIMDAIDGSYKAPVWNPRGYDVTPMKTYKNGKLPGYQDGLTPELMEEIIKNNQGAVYPGRRISPVRQINQWSSFDANRSPIVLPFFNAINGGTGTILNTFEPFDNISKTGGNVFDWFDVALNIATAGGGKLAKDAAKESSKTILKPIKQSIKKSLNPSNLGKYYAEHPEEITKITDSKELRDVVDFVNDHIAPKYAKKNKVQIGLKPEDISLGYADFGDVDLAAYAGPNNQVVLNKNIINDGPLVRNVLGHEVGGHIVDNNWPPTPSQMSEVQLALPFDQGFLKENNWFPAGAEANAVRRQFENLVSADNGNITGKRLDKLIEDMPRSQKKRYWSLMGYNDKINIDWNDLSKFNRALTSIPAAAAFVIPATQIGINTNDDLLSYGSRGFKNGKLPSYKNGVAQNDGRSYNPLYPVEKPLGKDQQYVIDDDGNWIRLSNPGMEAIVESRFPDTESDEQYTARRIAETQPLRTWLSDAADAADMVKTTALSLSPYTAIPYFGAKLIQDMYDNGISFDTLFDAAMLLPYARQINNIGRSAINLGISATKNIPYRLNPLNDKNKYYRVVGEDAINDANNTGFILTDKNSHFEFPYFTKGQTYRNSAFNPKDPDKFVISNKSGNLRFAYVDDGTNNISLNQPQFNDSATPVSKDGSINTAPVENFEYWKYNKKFGIPYYKRYLFSPQEWRVLKQDGEIREELMQKWMSDEVNIFPPLTVGPDFRRRYSPSARPINDVRMFMRDSWDYPYTNKDFLIHQEKSKGLPVSKTANGFDPVLSDRGGESMIWWNRNTPFYGIRLQYPTYITKLNDNLPYLSEAALRYNDLASPVIRTNYLPFDKTRAIIPLGIDNAFVGRTIFAK